jgi:hypothetical protein
MIKSRKASAEKMVSHHKTGLGGIKSAIKSWKPTDVIRLREDSDSEVIGLSIGDRSFKYFRVHGKKVKDREYVIINEPIRAAVKRAVRKGSFICVYL